MSASAREHPEDRRRRTRETSANPKAATAAENPAHRAMGTSAKKASQHGPPVSARTARPNPRRTLTERVVAHLPGIGS